MIKMGKGATEKMESIAEPEFFSQVNVNLIKAMKMNTQGIEKVVDRFFKK